MENRFNQNNQDPVQRIRDIMNGLESLNKRLFVLVDEVTKQRSGIVDDKFNMVDCHKELDSILAAHNITKEGRDGRQ